MRKRSQSSSISPNTSANESSDTLQTNEEAKFNNIIQIKRARRSGFVWLTLFAVIIYSSWTVHHYQFESLPVPLTADQAGKRGFSEVEAMKHVKALTELGPHPVGSDALDLALAEITEYAFNTVCFAASGKIKKTAHWEVDVEVDFFHVNSGASRLVSGMFVGRTLVYSDLNHIILRILPKYVPEAGESAILISSHIDTVFSTYDFFLLC
ncbi:uncharacterized protein LOC111294856 [Durio zibethinus]|uniref:Uncharacterized protein LOC111294856 n=1 Tax=Durio zibethinus TaxID=66656 RepID=A0A6P5YUW1_DURZI|nr:uncharacterized protein LOC111294856 [Durio zibethinus]